MDGILNIFFKRNCIKWTKGQELGNMKDIASIFRESARIVMGEKRGDQIGLARKTGIDPSYLNRVLRGKTPGSDAVRRGIAAILGFPNARYEEFLNIGRRELGIVPPEADPVPGYGEDTVTIPKAEYEALKSGAYQPEETIATPHAVEIISLLKKQIEMQKAIFSSPEGVDHTEVIAMQKEQMQSMVTGMSDILTAINALTDATQGHTRATGEAEEGIVAAIKQVSNEAHAIEISKMTDLLDEKDKRIDKMLGLVEYLKEDNDRLKKYLEKNTANLTLVPPEGGGAGSTPGNGNGNGNGNGGSHGGDKKVSRSGVAA